MPSKNGTTPNRFESELDDYPGYFELPHPFLDRHMRVWWAKAIKPLDKVNRLDYGFYDGEWLAAVELIKEYGAWKVEGVPVGILETDEVPSAVKGWVTAKADEYIYPFLPPKMLRLILANL